MSTPTPGESGCGVFTIVRTADTTIATDVGRRLADESQVWLDGGFGLRSARVHLGLDRTTVVHYGEWVKTSAPQTPSCAAGGPGIMSAAVVIGSPAVGIRGPAATARAGLAVVAIRHLSGPDAARAVLGLLADSATWKRAFPGFISATPYLSDDGRTFVNYPMWVDENAYRAWMRDPRIAEGQEEISRLETAPPEYLACTVMDDLVT